jgi:hypothetical protein
LKPYKKPIYQPQILLLSELPINVKQPSFGAGKRANLFVMQSFGKTAGLPFFVTKCERITAI